jgi:hypothetical protein
MGTVEPQESRNRANMSETQLYIIVLNETVPRRKRAYPLAEGGRLTVGRLPDADICLDQDGWRGVSKFHCDIHRRGDEIWIRDPHYSANGTWVNGERLPPAELVRVTITDHIRVAAEIDLQFMVRDPRWLAFNDGLIGQLAQAISDDRAFDRLPILADALEDAGCDNADILDHCRMPGEHARGCWVVDLILGKE